MVLNLEKILFNNNDNDNKIIKKNSLFKLILSGIIPTLFYSCSIPNNSIDYSQFVPRKVVAIVGSDLNSQLIQSADQFAGSLGITSDELIKYFITDVINSSILNDSEENYQRKLLENNYTATYSSPDDLTPLDNAPSEKIDFFRPNNPDQLEYYVIDNIHNLSETLANDANFDADYLFTLIHGTPELLSICKTSSNISNLIVSTDNYDSDIKENFKDLSESILFSCSTAFDWKNYNSNTIAEAYANIIGVDTLASRLTTYIGLNVRLDSQKTINLLNDDDLYHIFDNLSERLLKSNNSRTTYIDDNSYVYSIMYGSYDLVSHSSYQSPLEINANLLSNDNIQANIYNNLISRGIEPRLVAKETYDLNIYQYYISPSAHESYSVLIAVPFIDPENLNHNVNSIINPFFRFTKVITDESDHTTYSFYLEDFDFDGEFDDLYINSINEDVISDEVISELNNFYSLLINTN